jgi:cytochrome P450
MVVPSDLTHALILRKCHQRHGPVIRIGPNDLHVNDPEVFQDVTRVGSRFVKDPKFYKFITFPGTSIGETDPAAHRIRRQVLTPAFSPQRIQDLAPFIKQQVDKLLDRFSAFAKSSTPVDVNAASKAFTMDIISKILFGQQVGCLDDPEFRNDFVRYIKEAFEMGWTATAFPELTKFMLSVPEWLMKIVFPIPILVFKEVRSDPCSAICPLTWLCRNVQRWYEAISIVRRIENQQSRST